MNTQTTNSSTSAENGALSMIGLGALGGVIARQFVESGHSLTVWNRTAAKAEPVVDAGAEGAASAVDAISANEVTILCLNDKKSVDDLLAQDGVAAALRGRAIINLTTFSGDEVAALASWAADNDVRYVQGGVNAYPRDIGKEDSSILYGGNEELFRAYQETLRSIAGGQLFVGSDPSSVATFYLAMWSYYFSAIGGFYEAAALAAQGGVQFDQVLATVKSVMFPQIIGSLEDTASRIASGDFGPDQGRLANTANTIRDFAAAYDRVGLQGRYVHTTSDYLDAAVEAGDGDKNLGALLTTVSARAE